MTLAEVFLLLLIVGWYGSRLESEGKGTPAGVPATVPKQLFDMEQQHRIRAETSLAQKVREYEQLERILDWIAKTAGYPKQIGNVEEAKEAVNKIKSEAKRGRPACTSDNVLVNVVSDSGTLTATLRDQFLAGNRRYSAGERLSGVQIEQFLSEINSYYRNRISQASGDCVYDFTLLWRTDQDYRAARELFERHFYPAGIRQLR